MNKSHLVDSCIFISNITEFSYLNFVSSYCKSLSDVLCISDCILNELMPSIKLQDDEIRKEQKGLHQMVENSVKYGIIEMKCINSDERIKINFDKIRRKHYIWMTKPDTLERLIHEGKVTEDEVRSQSFKYKDYGECSLLAIALIDPNIYQIVSNDKGRIYLHEEEILYESYPQIKILDFMNWKKKLGF